MPSWKIMKDRGKDAETSKDFYCKHKCLYYLLLSQQYLKSKENSYIIFVIVLRRLTFLAVMNPFPTRKSVPGTWMPVYGAFLPCSTNVKRLVTRRGIPFCLQHIIFIMYTQMIHASWINATDLSILLMSLGLFFNFKINSTWFMNNGLDTHFCRTRTTWAVFLDADTSLSRQTHLWGFLNEFQMVQV